MFPFCIVIILLVDVDIQYVYVLVHKTYKTDIIIMVHVHTFGRELRKPYVVHDSGERYGMFTQSFRACFC